MGATEVTNPFEDPTIRKGRIGFAKLFFAVFAAFLLIQYSLVERVIGRYLAVHNAERPLAGQAWTSGVEKELAAGRSEVPEIASGVRGDLAQWILRTQRGRPTTLPLQRFATLWTSLPSYLSEAAIETGQWEKLALNPEVDRVRPSVVRKGIELVFLTTNNKPVSRFTMDKELVNRLMQHGQVLNDSITKANVEIRWMAGKDFQDRFTTMQSAERKAVWTMLNNDIVLHRPITRYGINRLDDAFSVLWLEYATPTVTTVSYVLPTSVAMSLGTGG